MLVVFDVVVGVGEITAFVVVEEIAGNGVKLINNKVFILN